MDPALVSEVDKKLLTSLFRRFEVAAVGYCVLRNHENLPESLGGSDLDIAVSPADEDVIYQAVREVIHQHGGQIIVEYSGSVKVLRCLGFYQGVWWGLAIDLFTSIQYKGVEYIATSSIIERSCVYSGINVAAEHDANTVALVKELLTNSRSRKNYFQVAVEQYAQKQDGALKILKQAFSNKTIAFMEELLSAGIEDKSAIHKLSAMMRDDVIGQSWILKFPSRIKNVLYRYRRIINPPGLCVAFLGTDGSGKTTMIEAIKPVLYEALHSEIQYEHMRPNWLPSLGVALGKRSEESHAVVVDPHAETASGLMGSLIRLTYYVIDYTVGYWVKIYPMLIKKPHLCVFDRYYYDFLLDQRRMKIKLPAWIVRLACSFNPQPKLIICLGGDPDMIHKRKPEISLDEVKRQTEALKRLSEQNKLAVWVNTGQSISDSRHCILQAIQDAYLRKR